LEEEEEKNIITSKVKPEMWVATRCPFPAKHINDSIPVCFSRIW